ncbi:MAG: hypothetical protein AABY22_21950 [Nanoarchaeota archaeon]
MKKVTDFYIEESAIRRNGVVWTGRRHHEIIKTIIETLDIKRVDGEQGFVTNDGVFVDRQEGGRIALACGQIKNLKYHKTKLFSEDIFE